MSKALFEKIPIDAKLSNVLLQYIIKGYDYHSRLKVEDLKAYDHHIYNSIKFIAEEPSLDLDANPFFFTVMADTGEEIELVPNGREIRVTKENRKQFGNKVAHYYLFL